MLVVLLNRERKRIPSHTYCMQRKRTCLHMTKPAANVNARCVTAQPDSCSRPTKQDLRLAGHIRTICNGRRWDAHCCGVFELPFFCQGCKDQGTLPVTQKLVGGCAVGDLQVQSKFPCSSSNSQTCAVEKPLVLSVLTLWINLRYAYSGICGDPV